MTNHNKTKKTEELHYIMTKFSSYYSHTINHYTSINVKNNTEQYYQDFLKTYEKKQPQILNKLKKHKTRMLQLITEELIKEEEKRSRKYLQLLNNSEKRKRKYQIYLHELAEKTRKNEKKRKK